jgi:hypothetical protein
MLSFMLDEAQRDAEVSLSEDEGHEEAAGA